MNTSLAALHHGLADRVGWILLHSLWQGALIGLSFVLVRFALRRRSADVRYLAGCLALALLLVAPVVTVLVRVMPSPQFNLSSSGPVRQVFVPTAPPVAVQSPDVGGASSWYLQWVADFCARLAPLLAATWLAGVAFFSIRLSRSWWWVRTLRTKGNELVDPTWMETLNDLRGRLEISRPVRLLKSALVEVPTVIGWLRPVILLPAATLTGLTPTQLEAILAHELAHVRRLDYLVNVFQCLIETLMFYHPAVWWISRCVREERENCCDDLVVKVCGDRLAYARALATLEECRADLPQFAFAASGGSLLNRIRRLLGAPEQNAPVTVGQVAGFVLLGIGSLMILLGICFMLGPTTYSSTARIKIERGESSQWELNHSPSFSSDPYFIQTEFEVMASATVLGKVIKDLNLNEEWGKKHGSGQPLKTSESIALLKHRLEIRPIRNTSFVEIRVLSGKGKEAADIANDIAEAYREHRHAQRKQLSSGGIAALEERWKEQEARVREAQAKVDRLREDLKIPDSVAGGDAPQPLMSAETLRHIEGMRIESEAEVARQETLLNKLNELRVKLGPEGMAQTIPTAAQDAQLGSLLEQLVMVEQKMITLEKDFGPTHAEVLKVKSQAADLHNKITIRVDGILSGLAVKVASLKEGVAKMDRDIEKALSTDIEKSRQSRPYFDAKRNLEELQRFRQILTMKIESEKIDQNLPRTMLVEITDPAYPGVRPVSPNRPRATALIILGILLDLIGVRMLKGNPRPNLIARPA